MDCFILGGGVTGLAAGWASGLKLYEAEEAPGGICSSYYVRPGNQERLRHAPVDDEAYRFELGGGHWIFGGDPAIIRFIWKAACVKTYERLSSVYFPDQGLYVPYPLQNHLGHLSQDLRTKALVEILAAPKLCFRTMQEWLIESFGATLTKLFFGPFHELYTSGLWTRIAPQDAYKSPISAESVIRGASGATANVGYNTSYIYPQHGLNALVQRMAERCNVRTGKRVARIDPHVKRVEFEDGTEARYESVISTLPLNKMMNLTGLNVAEATDPYTSVLVLNIGALRGSKCPNDHWLYLPNTAAGFHRVGFYSNVDTSFLPASSRDSKDRVSIYVERAYPGGSKPSPEDIAKYSEASIRELRAWGFINDPEVVDPTWIEVAYTWAWPGSNWRGAALKALEEHDIQMVGRYGRWTFQGIADSLRDGFYVGAAMRETGNHGV